MERGRPIFAPVLGVRATSRNLFGVPSVIHPASPQRESFWRRCRLRERKASPGQLDADILTYESLSGYIYALFA